jgi:hypothetical protein
MVGAQQSEPQTEITHAPKMTTDAIVAGARMKVRNAEWVVVEQAVGEWLTARKKTRRSKT